jgi:hypothetical protein
VPVIPINGDPAPSDTDNRAKIGRRGSPANTVAYFEKSGLVARHLRFTLGGSTSSTPVHCVVARKALVPVVPFYCDVLRPNRDDLTAVCRVLVKAYATAKFEFFGLFGGHFLARNFVL